MTRLHEAWCHYPEDGTKSRAGVCSRLAEWDCACLGTPYRRYSAASWLERAGSQGGDPFTVRLPLCGLV